jgi:hypothetical protein
MATIVFQQGVQPTGAYSGCKDTHIYVLSPDTNYSTATQLDFNNLFTPTYNRHILIKFDISSIPSGSTINSAVLNVYGVETDVYSGTISAFRVLRNWVDTQATWNIYSTGNNWGTAGCQNTTTDRSSSAEDTYIRSAWDGAGWYDFNLTTAVQNWLDSVWENDGVLLQITAGTIADANPYSSEYATNTSLRPTLTVDYTSGGETFLTGVHFFDF